MEVSGVRQFNQLSLGDSACLLGLLGTWAKLSWVLSLLRFWKGDGAARIPSQPLLHSDLRLHHPLPLTNVSVVPGFYTVQA